VLFVQDLLDRRGFSFEHVAFAVKFEHEALGGWGRARRDECAYYRAKGEKKSRHQKSLAQPRRFDQIAPHRYND
jgi:hypothetical protein